MKGEGNRGPNYLRKLEFSVLSQTDGRRAQLLTKTHVSESEPSSEGSTQRGTQRGTHRTTARGCSTCRHRKRPVLSAGYCGGGRDDLPGAYGLHHPLRKLPDDQGEGCASYQTIED